MKAKLNTVAKILLIAFFLYLFLVSIGLMGKAFKGFGAGFAENLISTTSNPFIGLFIGILATSLIQSSSTTTSIVVGMVGSGVLTVGNHYGCKHRDDSNEYASFFRAFHPPR